MSVVDDLAWDEAPSLLDKSELSSSPLDSPHVSQMDEDDEGEMELSSSLSTSLASVSDSDDDHNPLFPKPHSLQPAAAADSPQLSHLTERQQLAFLMRTTQQQRVSSSKQPSKRQSAPLPPLHPVNVKPKPQQPSIATKPLAFKPSMLTHDKKRRRTAAVTAIDPDDSHLYSVQRLPPADTAPAPLPVPAEYGKWSAEQRRRWDRVSEQPGLYHYHHTAPGVAVRVDGWDEAEVELLLHLLVCHPLAGGARKAQACEWGLFSINLPGRVGAECERKWKELTAAGRVWSEDKFDYMRWYERQKERSIPRAATAADSSAVPALVKAAAGASAPKPASASPPTVLNRKRVGAPTEEPATDNYNAKREVEVTAAPAPLPGSISTALAQPEAVLANQSKANVNGEVRGETQAAAKQTAAVHEQPLRRDREKGRVEAREQPLRKKTVRFHPTPLPTTKIAPPPTPPARASTEPAAIDSSTAVSAAASTSTMAARRPPPLRVSIPAQPASTLADDDAPSALWPARPPRAAMPASIVPSTITPLRTAAAVDKRLDATQLTVRNQTAYRKCAAHQITRRAYSHCRLWVNCCLLLGL